MRALFLAITSAALTVFAQSAAGEIQNVSIRVFPDGKLTFNDALVTLQAGVSIPEAILSAQDLSPSRTHTGRDIWYSFEALGLLVTRKDDAKSLHAAIVLPVVPGEPFEKIQFKGKLILDKSHIDFSTGKPVFKNDVIKMVTRELSPSIGLNQDAECVTVSFENTVVYLLFDEGNKLHHITISVRVN